MAEVFVQFANPVVAKDGTLYRAQACGAPNADGMWEGWIEFLPLDNGPALRSSRPHSRASSSSSNESTWSWKAKILVAALP